MLVQGSRLGVAVSGGADSVVLLHILHSLAPETDQQLTVLHVNHQLRGVESDADEEFVRQLARSLRLPLLCVTAPVIGGNMEQEARRSRQSFFQLCKTEHGIGRIALGHTRTDQAETVLLRLLRGASLAGLSAMAPVTRSGLIRPLLFTSREDVRSFARAVPVTWREDRSNNDLRFRRNRLRLETMPQLAHHYNPGLESVLARTAELAQAEEQYWEGAISKLYRRLVKPTPFGLTLSAGELGKLHLARRRRLLRRALFILRKDLRSIDLSHIDGVLQICHSEHGHDRLMLPGVDAIRSFDTLLLTGPATMKQPRDYDLAVPFSTRLPLPFQSGYLSINPAEIGEQNCVTVKNTAGFSTEDAFLNRDIVKLVDPGENFRVRNWEPGDKFQPAGSSSPEKIKTLFQQNRVLLWERRHWPVLVVGGEVAWVRGFGSDAKFQAREDAGVLRVRFEQGI